MLAEIYNWFTEGFDTADLKDAKALLDELRNMKMQCANCGTDNPPEQKFWAKCATPLEESLSQLRIRESLPRSNSVVNAPRR